MTVELSWPRPGVALIEIADPETRNALTAETVAGLETVLAAYDDDPAGKAAVLTGRGPVFCSGGNTKAMGSARPKPLARKEAMWRGLQALLRGLHALDKPLIAAVNGPAVGAGADLALHCDIRYVAETAYLRTGYIDLGLVPGAGAAWLLPRLVGTSRALELLWTGRRVDAAEALELGLASRVVPVDELLDASLDLAATIATKPAHVVRLVKRMVRDGASMPIGAALDLASSHFAVLQETEDHAEGVAALRERRDPRFQDR